MKFFYSIMFIVLFCFSCKSQKETSTNSKSKAANFTVVSVETVLTNDSLSVRALTFDKKDHKIWFTGTNGIFGYYDFNLNSINKSKIKFKDKALQFRSIAATSDYILIASIESPGLLIKVNKSTLDYQLVYKDDRTECFFDSMKFWDNNNGIVMGDAINNHFNIILTQDGGTTWKPIANQMAPKAIEGEGGFAASNSCLATFEDNVWIFTGGKKARVFHSADKGKEWNVYETPIISGNTMTGIFSGTFYDSKKGCIAGGDYENQEAINTNIAFTTDGGKTWIAEKTEINLGYISCVQYVPNGNGEQFIAIANKGIYTTSNNGKKWTLLHTEKDLYAIEFATNNQAIVSGKNKLLKVTFKN